MFLSVLGKQLFFGEAPSLRIWLLPSKIAILSTVASRIDENLIYPAPDAIALKLHYLFQSGHYGSLTVAVLTAFLILFFMLAWTEYYVYGNRSSQREMRKRYLVCAAVVVFFVAIGTSYGWLISYSNKARVGDYLHMHGLKSHW
jgi:hypothetical protein